MRVYTTKKKPIFIIHTNTLTVHQTRSDPL